MVWTKEIVVQDEMCPFWNVIKTECALMELACFGMCLKKRVHEGFQKCTFQKGHTPKETNFVLITFQNKQIPKKGQFQNEPILF